MGRKKIWIPIAIAAMSILGLILYSQMRSEGYAPADNEILTWRFARKIHCLQLLDFLPKTFIM